MRTRWCLIREVRQRRLVLHLFLLMGISMYHIPAGRRNVLLNIQDLKYTGQCVFWRWSYTPIPAFKLEDDMQVGDAGVQQCRCQP